MGLKIYWTDFAKSELQTIFKYYFKKASPRVAQELIESIIQHTKNLSTQQSIGAKEPLLEEREKEFRYLVFKNYKIIYWHNLEKNRIDIVDVFDTRQNPIKMKRN